MFTPIKAAPPGIVAFNAEGRVTDEDYKTVLIPAIDAALKAHGKLRALVRFGPEYEGYTLHAMLDDTVLGVGHWNDFERAAVVTDVDWIVHGVHLFAPLIPAKVRTFPIGALSEAIAWVSEEPE